VLEERAGEAADLTHTGVNVGPRDVSRGSPKARAGETGHSEATVTPEAAANSTLGGKASIAPTVSSASTQSCAGRFQKEWADTASSAGPGEAGKKVLTLKKLGEQLGAVRELMRNTGLQFVDAEKTVTLSRLLVSRF
jgi:hypothetical protein